MKLKVIMFVLLQPSFSRTEKFGGAEIHRNQFISWHLCIRANHNRTSIPLKPPSPTIGPHTLRPCRHFQTGP
jgi:hypothetical protein